jgi:signal transduction histidine kinase
MIPEFLSGGGEMGERIRDFDWAATPLGPVEDWPQSLRTCIRIMLVSRQPIWIGWGKELIKFYNDPYKAIVGGKHPWAMGTPASIVWKDIWRDIGPMLHTVMEKDEGIYMESQLLIMERNGYPEETYYTFSYTPITGDDGGTAGMICFNSDDTERILGERQLRTQMLLSSRLKEARSNAEAIHQTITTLKDNPHDFPFVLFRKTGEEGDLAPECEKALTTRSLQVVKDPGSRLSVQNGMPAPFSGMSTGAWELPPHTGVVLPVFQPGTREAYGYLIIGINPYRLPDERYMGFFALVNDQLASTLADLHALEAERQKAAALAEIDRAKTTFFSNISHEFRTPLTLLLGPIEDVLNDPESKDINRYRMGVAYRNVLRMQKLVNTLLEFSRIEADRVEGKYSRVDLSAFTRELASSFRSAVEKAGMQLIISGGTIADAVYVDVDLWEQIVLNLVSNAFKYTRTGSIEVLVEQLGTEVILRVTDTGVGIPGEHLERIFDRFHRIEEIRGRSQEGTGIGLAMVKELVRLHQGTITVTSTVGEGSTFTVALPVGKDHLPADKIVEPAIVGLKYAESFVTEALKWLPGGDENPGTGNGAGSEAKFHRKTAGTVLLADDNADMREYMQRLLSEQFTVITAMDGEEAYAKMLLYRPDLLLSDIMMPALDGFGLLRKMRSNVQLQHIPVILLSARAGEEAKVEGLEAGADDYMVKPFSARELLARVDANIRIARSRMEHADQLEKEVALRTQELLERTEELRELTLSLQQLNGSLQKSNEDLQQFAHVASHDLKEPVRKIRTFSTRIQEEYGAGMPEQARVWLSKIEQATQRMVSMIEGVLAYSILNGNEQPAELIDLNIVFRNIESDLEIVMGERAATIHREELPLIEGAPVLIYQLFYNLINNSLKFARAGAPPVITIRCRVVDGLLEITLTDNGIGFGQEHAARIFDTFTRLHARDKYEGTGLGLALCKKIVERHHGVIRASGEKDKGAVFTLQLPLVQQGKNI